MLKRLSVEINKDLHQKLKTLAAANGTTVKEIIVTFLTQLLDQK